MVRNEIVRSVQPHPRVAAVAGRSGAFRTLALAFLLFALLGAAEEPAWRSDDTLLKDPGGQPLALLFTTETCTWCHRMIEESDASPAVRQALVAVPGVIVDADQHRGLVARLQIEAYPSLVLINRQGRIVKVVRGYLAENDLVTVLRVHALHGDEVDGDAFTIAPPDLAALARAPDGAAKLVALLGTGDPEQRQALRTRLATMPAARETLWTALADPLLAVRVDAAAVLAAQVAAVGDYDPFAPLAARSASAAAWRERTKHQGEVLP